MRKTLLLIASSLLMILAIDAQVTSIKYIVEYNDNTELYDCKLYVEKGSASTLPQRIQFNAQFTLVVPPDAEFEIVDRYFPLENNQNYDGTEPCEWFVIHSVTSPPCHPENKFYSIVPDLTTICLYNDLNEGDTISLFSILVDADPCENSVRPYDNALDYCDGPPFGTLDNSNGFTLGSINQIYNGNITSKYGTLELDDPIELCVGMTTSFYPEVPAGMWESTNADVAIVNPSTGTITSLSGGKTDLIFIDDATGCLSQFEVTVFDEPVLTTEGSLELCVGENGQINSTEEGFWISNNPTIATIDNNGTITAISEGQTDFIFTSNQGCSAVSQNVTVISTNDPLCSVVGLDEQLTSEFKIYPNPTNDLILIESERIINSVSLFDANYQLVRKIVAEGKEKRFEIDLQDVNSGMYILSIESNAKTIYKRVVKK